jgi:hypothetical protein
VKLVLTTLWLALLCNLSPCFGQAFIEGPGADEDPAHARRAQREDLDAKLRSLAGTEAVFCGHVGFGESSRETNRCVQMAFRQKKAFYVGYDSGHDAKRYTSNGLVRDANGGMFAVGFDSAVLSGRADGELSDNSHIVTVLCPAPYHLYEGRNGGAILSSWHLPPANQVSCRLFVK